MSLFRRISNLLFRSQVDNEISAEFRAHLEMRAEDNVAAGLTPEEARRDALLRFGNPTSMKERVTSADAALSLESLWSDIRYAIRQMRKRPGFSLTCILILALGMGASTAIFSVVSPVLFEALPYPEANRLVSVGELRGQGARLPSFGTFRGIEEGSRSFEAVAVSKPWQPTLIGEDHGERFEGQRVSADYFRVLGAHAFLGREFRASDDQDPGAHVLILSDALWHLRFAADRSILGRKIILDDTLFTVVGVMPKDFEDVLVPSAELWAPLQYDSTLPVDGREWGHHLQMIGRLAAGVSTQEAQSEIGTVLPSWEQAHSKGYDGTGGPPNGIEVVGLQRNLTGAVRPALLAVLAGVLLVLCIACANVANLLLGRGTQRASEFSMRLMLGAARRRILRQLITESLVLSMAAAVVGLLISIVGIRFLAALGPSILLRFHAVSFSGSVFGFSLLLVSGTGLLVGVAPAWQACRREPRGGVQSASQRTATSSRGWVRSSLVVAEIALAFVLLICTGLLLRSMGKLLTVDPGFEAQDLITMQVQEYGHRFDSASSRDQFFSATIESVLRVPGVISAGFTSQLPLSGESDVYGVEFDKDHQQVGDSAFRYAVTPGYIETMHLPLLRGRLLIAQDREGTPQVVLLNESFARRKFGSLDVLGQRVRLGPDAGHSDHPWATVIGVVGDVKQQSLAVAKEDAFYLPATQWNWGERVYSLVIRTHQSPESLLPSLRKAIWSIDKDQPIVRVATMEQIVKQSEAKRRFVLLLFQAFGLVALVLVMAGVFAVVSAGVDERTREIGVRSALGASRESIIAMVLRQGVVLVSLGSVFGAVGAIIASRAMLGMLFGISELDPVTYFAVVGLLLTLSAAASVLPARRAAGVSPIQALRTE